MGKFFPSSRTQAASGAIIAAGYKDFACTSTFKNWSFSFFVIFLTFQIWRQQGLPSEAGEKDPSSLLSHDSS